MMPLIFVGTCDLAGKVRGKGFPASQLEKRLKRGIGWTPTNVQINCFDGIAESPFGALGDLLLVPDAGSRVEAIFENRTEHLMLGDIVTLEGKPWNFCARSILKSALSRLEKVASVHLLAAFEHEFQLKGSAHELGDGYGRTGFEAQRLLCELLMSKIAEANLAPDSIMKEYGSNQYEVVIGPEKGVRAADAAVITRELTRSCSRNLGEEATFTPIRDPSSIGNGVHIHMSFIDKDAKPATYDANGVCGMSALTSSFSAGVLKYLDSILALTAPSVISYLRLTPHRWSAAFNNIGLQDREASLRICPGTNQDENSIAHQFNIEYRAADSAACPHLALAAIVHAGVQGIEEGLVSPQPTEEDLSTLSPDELAKRGFVRLPQTLEDALERLANNETVVSWFPENFVTVYDLHKRSEIKHVSELDIDECCALYERTY